MMKITIDGQRGGFRVTANSRPVERVFGTKTTLKGKFSIIVLLRFGKCAVVLTPPERVSSAALSYSD